MFASNFLKARQAAEAQLIRKYVEIQLEGEGSTSSGDEMKRQRIEKSINYFKEKLKYHRYLDVKANETIKQIDGIVGLLEFNGQHKKARHLEDLYVTFINEAALSLRFEDVHYAVLQLLMSLSISPMKVPMTAINESISRRKNIPRVDSLYKKPENVREQEAAALQELRLIVTEYQRNIDIDEESSEDTSSDDLSSEDTSSDDLSSVEESSDEASDDSSKYTVEEKVDTASPAAAHKREALPEGWYSIEDFYSFEHILNSLELATHIRNTDTLAATTKFQDKESTSDATSQDKESNVSADESIRSFQEMAAARGTKTPGDSLAVLSHVPETKYSFVPSKQAFGSVTEAYILQQTINLMSGFVAAPFYEIQKNLYIPSDAAQTLSHPIPDIFQLNEDVYLEHLSRSCLRNCLESFTKPASSIYFLSNLLDSLDQQLHTWNESTPIHLPFTLLSFVPHLKGLEAFYREGDLELLEDVGDTPLWGRCMQSMHYCLSICMNQWRFMLQELQQMLITKSMVEMNLPLEKMLNPFKTARNIYEQAEGPLPSIFTMDSSDMVSYALKENSAMSLLWLENVLEKHSRIWEEIASLFERILFIPKLFVDQMKTTPSKENRHKQNNTETSESLPALISSYILAEVHHLTHMSQISGDVDRFNVWVFFLSHVRESYYTILQTFISQGEIDDSYNEFPIAVSRLNPTVENLEHMPYFPTDFRYIKIGAHKLMVADDTAGTMAKALINGEKIRISEFIKSLESQNSYSQVDKSTSNDLKIKYDELIVAKKKFTNQQYEFKNATQYERVVKKSLQRTLQMGLNDLLHASSVYADALFQDALWRHCMMKEYFTAIRAVAFLEAKDFLRPFVDHLTFCSKGGLKEMNTPITNDILQSCLSDWGSSYRVTADPNEAQWQHSAKFSQHAEPAKNTDENITDQGKLADMKRLKVALRSVCLQLAPSACDREDGPIHEKCPFRNLRIRCKVTWPLNYVLDDFTMDRYSLIFCHLVKLEANWSIMQKIFQLAPYFDCHTLYSSALTDHIQRLAYSFGWKLRVLLRSLLWHAAWTLKDALKSFQKYIAHCKSIADIAACQKHYLDSIYQLLLLPRVETEPHVGPDKSDQSTYETGFLDQSFSEDDRSAELHKIEANAAALLKRLLLTPQELYTLVIEAIATLYCDAEISGQEDTDYILKALQAVGDVSISEEREKSSRKCLENIVQKMQSEERSFSITLRNFLNALEKRLAFDDESTSETTWTITRLQFVKDAAAAGSRQCADDEADALNGCANKAKLSMLRELLDLTNFYRSATF